MKVKLFILVIGILCSSPSIAEETRFHQDAMKICFNCHGQNGASTQPLYPILAGQQEYYLYVQLKDFKSGLRAGPEMSAVVTALTKEEMKAMAKYFNQHEWPNLGIKATPETIKQGLTAISAGQCVQCHRGGFEGGSGVPRLAGQHPEYLLKTMLDFKYKRRTNAAAKSSLFASFSDEDIEALANYLASLTVHKASQPSEIE